MRFYVFLKLIIMKTKSPIKANLLFCLIAGITFFSNQAKGQTPTKCLEIQSILVDACGSPEGENEMLTFKIGPTAINTSDLSITWPSNPYLGISPANALTASIVSTLNSTIISCGRLIEPTGGVLPAGKNILMVTSTAMSTAANSFSTLTDTLYIIFQNAGNTAGHFANYSTPSGLRTTIIKQISTGCSDTATYDKVLLTNIMGGYGGTIAQRDGATVQFSWPGTATYVNNGCMAPFIPITSNAGTGSTICIGSAISLSGTASGNYSSVIWQTNGGGTFSPSNSLSTTFTAPLTTGNVTLTLGAIGPCQDTTFSTVVMNVISIPSPAISASGSTTICAGNSVTLTASGGSTYTWNTGASTSSIAVSASGTYTVTATNTCGSQTATQAVTVNSLPSATVNSAATTVCSGGSLLLWSTGTGSFLWSNGINNDSTIISTGGTYYVIASNSCGSINDTIVISTSPLPSPIISASGSTTICAGDSVVLTASGGSSYLWSTGSSNPVITVSAAGTFTVTATNSCGSNAVTINVSIINSPIVSITPVGSTTICIGDNLTLNANGGGTYLWSTGSTANTINVNSQGTYWVVASNICGLDSASTNVITDSVTALFSSTIVSGIFPLPVNFTNASSSNAVTYSWSFGDGNTSSLFSPSNIFQNPGTYTVTLTVTNSNGCSDVYTMQIIVLETASTLIIPNVFSPNADGNNDMFFVTSTGIKNFDCVIFDRWGLKIAELNKISQGWDGKTSAGLFASDGTYYYVIKATGLDNKVYDKTGFVSLLR
jgi:gliding motility-associated-like protein